MKSLNLAARAERWSAEHWKTATAIWLVFVLAAVMAGQLAGTHKLSDSEQSTGESARAQQMLATAGFSTPAPTVPRPAYAAATSGDHSSVLHAPEP